MLEGLPLPLFTAGADGPKGAQRRQVRHWAYVTFEATGTRRACMRRLHAAVRCLLLRGALLALALSCFSLLNLFAKTYACAVKHCRVL